MINAIDEPKKALAGAASRLASGGLVAIPTETVYGLAADATNGKAVANIFEAKGRPQFNPLICHVSGLEMAEKYGQFSPLVRQLARKFWPGPLTVVVPLQDDCCIHPLVSAGLDTIALRAPRGIMADIAGRLARPVAAPSANISGRISPTLATHVAEELGDNIDLIVDGGPCKIGLESTIIKIDSDDVVLLRAGGTSAEVLENFIQRPLVRPAGKSAIQAPGMMASHYAPRSLLRLNATSLDGGEALLAFGDQPIANAEKAIAVLNLSPSGNPAEAAQNLFAYLKQLDAAAAKTIAVQPIPADGLGEAINDRLRRAAAPRHND